MPRTWALIGADGKYWRSPAPGTLGGHRGSKIYGRLDCRTALQAIARGGYVKHRVFFLDEAAAIAAGYRPCGVCLPEKHAAWKRLRDPCCTPAAPERLSTSTSAPRWRTRCSMR